MDKDYDIKIKENFWEDDDEFNENPIPEQPRRRRAAAVKKKRKRKKRPAVRLLIIFALIAAILFIFVLPPRQTVFLLAGTDAGGTRTDTLMLGVLNSGLKSELTLVSIPRDTLISVSDKTYDKMHDEYPHPSGKGMKINEIYHFAGEKQGMKLLVGEIEDKFDLNIDYYAKIDFEALGYIVDSIGGVTFDVPMAMNYTDPVQNLSIHLEKGVQVLDGDKAQQLLRFRAGYARADLERVEVQQAFIKAFLSQALSAKNIFAHGGDYIKAFTEYIDTNFNILTAGRYVSCALTLNFDEIETATMPGRTGTDFGRSGYLSDLEEFSSLYGEKYR